jgi:hypothetical protein
MADSNENFKIFLKNPRTGRLLAGDIEYFSLDEAKLAAENWQAVQHLGHWHVEIRDHSGTKVFEQ